MEEQSLKDYLEKYKRKKNAGDVAVQPWYNRYGDCVEYQTEQVALVADRIDRHLTLYRSAVTDIPVGFQLKDVQALMKKYQANAFEVRWTEKEGRLVSVIALLLTAMEDDLPLSIKTRSGYYQAIKNLAQTNDTLALAVQAT